MTANAEQLAAAVTAAAAEELTKAFGRIRHCVEQLSEEQVWWRPAADVNSVANLMLHLAGNLRQYVGAGLGGAADVRQRPQEFAERGPIAKAELLRRLEAVVTEARQVLANLSADELLRVRRVQKADVNALQALFRCVPHFQGHTQEIIHLTRRQLGDAYRYAGPPATA